MQDPAGRHVLLVGLEAFDRMRSAQQSIAADGSTCRDRFGQVRAHPLLSVERDARAQFMAAMKALGFDLGSRPLGGS